MPLHSFIHSFPRDWIPSSLSPIVMSSRMQRYIHRTSQKRHFLNILFLIFRICLPYRSSHRPARFCFILLRYLGLWPEFTFVWTGVATPRPQQPWAPESLSEDWETLIWGREIWNDSSRVSSLISVRSFLFHFMTHVVVSGWWVSTHIRLYWREWQNYF